MRFFQRSRPFWIALFLTVCLFTAAIGMITVDYRCRMMTNPPKQEAAAFELDDLADGEGLLRLQWFESETEFHFQADEKLLELFEVLPALIPRPLRAAAVLEQAFSEMLPEEVSAAVKEIFSP